MARPLKPVDENQKEIIRAINAGLNPEEVSFLFNKSTDSLKGLFLDALKNDPDILKRQTSRRNRLIREKYGQKTINKIRQCIKTQIAEMIVREMGSIEFLIGYSIEELLIDFEKKFKSGMSWSNHGKWHIDHKKPRAEFTAKEIKEAFAFKNLQPLWAKDNMRKAAKWQNVAAR